MYSRISFQLLCGTDPLPELYRAKKYKINDHFMTKKDFQHMMMNLPEEVRISQVPSNVYIFIFLGE